MKEIIYIATGSPIILYLLGTFIMWDWDWVSNVHVGIRLFVVIIYLIIMAIYLFVRYVEPVDDDIPKEDD